MRTRLSNAAPMKPGSWTGTVTQEMVVQGTATSGMEVDATGRSSGDLSLKVKCNGKATGTFDGGTFTIDGTFSLAGFSTPLQCTGTTGERPVAGKVRKGSAKLPVIDLTYGEATDETFDCGAGPFGDALTQAFAQNEATTATSPGAPTGSLEELGLTPRSRRASR